MEECKVARGCDRHLLGLSAMAAVSAVVPHSTYYSLLIFVSWEHGADYLSAIVD